MQDTAVRGYGGVDIILARDTKRKHDINIKITLAIRKIFRTQTGFVRRNKNADDVVFDFVAELVGLGLIKRDYKIL